MITQGERVISLDKHSLPDCSSGVKKFRKPFLSSGTSTPRLV